MPDASIVVGLMVTGVSLRRRIKRLVSKKGWDSFDIEGDQAPPPSCVLIVDADRLGEVRDVVPVVALTYGPEMRHIGFARADVRAVVDRDDVDEAFLEAVCEVSAGHGWISPTLVRPLLRGRSPMGQKPLSSSKARAYDPQLTAREYEVASLVTQGMNNSEIAGALYIAESTVKYHISNILQKTGYRDRSQLTARMPIPAAL